MERSPLISGSVRARNGCARSSRCNSPSLASSNPRTGSPADASRTLELANKAYSLYVKQNPVEQAKLLKMVLSNCKIDAVSFTPTYRKLFDLIFARAKNGVWRARSDDFRTLVLA